MKKTIFILLKWMNRRSQKRPMTYEHLRSYMCIYPPPRMCVVHRLY